MSVVLRTMCLRVLLSLPLPFSLMAILAVSEGCLLPIPLAVYPAPDKGSGLRITFYDEAGEHIRRDGLVLVHREYYAEIAQVYGIRPPPTSSELLDIHQGVVTLPQRCKLSFLWLAPLYMPWYLVVIETPTENVWLYPFISGYTRDGSISYDDYKNGCLTLLNSSGREVDAFIRWDIDFDRIRSPDQPSSTVYSDQSILTKPDYLRLTAYIEAERVRLRKHIPPTHPVLGGITSQPECGPSPTSQP